MSSDHVATYNLFSALKLLRFGYFKTNNIYTFIHIRCIMFNALIFLMDWLKGSARIMDLITNGKKTISEHIFIILPN